MNIKNNIVSALDIGTSKVCCMIANEKTDSICKVIGVGYNKSQGINSGIITDFFAAINSISSSIKSAEKQAGVKIKNGLYKMVEDELCLLSEERYLPRKPYPK